MTLCFLRYELAPFNIQMVRINLANNGFIRPTLNALSDDDEDGAHHGQRYEATSTGPARQSLCCHVLQSSH